MWRKTERLRFKNETKLQPQIPKHMKKSNAKKGSQHNQSFSPEEINFMGQSEKDFKYFRLLKDTRNNVHFKIIKNYEKQE